MSRRTAIIITVVTILLGATIWWYVATRPEVQSVEEKLQAEVEMLKHKLDSLERVQDTLIIREYEVVTKWRTKNEIETRIIYAADPRELVQLRAGLRDSIRRSIQRR